MQIRIAGYAVSGGGRGIERVDVSIDGGKTWFEANRYQKNGVPYVSDDDISCDKWGWVLFEAVVSLQSENADIVVKAVCTNIIFFYWNPFFFLYISLVDH